MELSWQSAFLTSLKPRLTCAALHIPGREVCTAHPSTGEAEAGVWKQAQGWLGQVGLGQSQLHGEIFVIKKRRKNKTNKVVFRGEPSQVFTVWSITGFTLSHSDTVLGGPWKRTQIGFFKYIL